jgi:superfamily II DNA or RNA helicase
MIKYPFTLSESQTAALTKFYKNKGNLIISLPTGMGKTVVAVAAIVNLKNEKPDCKVLVISPASLKHNIDETLTHFKLKRNIKSAIVSDMSNFEKVYKDNNVISVSYQFAMYNLSRIYNNHDFDFIITDEMHKAKNFISRTFATLWILRLKTPMFLGLTASFMSNDISELLALVAIVSKNPEFIKSGPAFIRKNAQGKLEISNVRLFKRLVGPWLYIPSTETISSSTAKTPTAIEKVIEIQMTDKEWIAYKYAIRSIPKEILIRFFNGTITPPELRSISSTLMAAQMVLLSADYIKTSVPIESATPSTKVIYVAEKIKEDKLKSIIFTPFLKYGAELINRTLNEMGVKSVVYAGPVSSSDRLKIVDRFENGDLQTICLTGAGAEGLNLPSCHQVYFLTLSYNPEVMIQVMGRALRMTSKLESVDIFYILSKYKSDVTIDYRILEISQRKRFLKKAVHDALGEGMSAAGLTAYSTYEPIGFVKNKQNTDINNKGIFGVNFPLI